MSLVGDLQAARPRATRRIQRGNADGIRSAAHVPGRPGAQELRARRARRCASGSRRSASTSRRWSSAWGRPCSSAERGNVAPDRRGTGSCSPTPSSIVSAVRRGHGAHCAPARTARSAVLVLAASTVPGEYLMPAAPGRAAPRAIRASARGNERFRLRKRPLPRCSRRRPTWLSSAASRATGGSIATVFAQRRDRARRPGAESRSRRTAGSSLKDAARRAAHPARAGSRAPRDAIARILPAPRRAQRSRCASAAARPAKRCVQHGLGLAFLSRQAVATELAAGLFQVVELPGHARAADILRGSEPRACRPRRPRARSSTSCIKSHR